MKIAVLPGDGIGPEVIREGLKVLHAVESRFGCEFELNEGLIGGACIDRTGVPICDETLQLGLESDAVLFGAVGGPKWDRLPVAQIPNAGLFVLRKKLDAYANIRPVKVFPALVEILPVKRSLVESGVDILIVRELTGGSYYGAPRFRAHSGNAIRAVDTIEYSTEEIGRVAEVAFRLAEGRAHKLTSVDKSNVLETSKLWRETVDEAGRRHPDVRLDHLLADVASMRLITNPSDFDVIVTGNLFGDLLSDEGGALAGSLGMLPSASIGDGKTGLYEPVHGSAPDIAGKQLANPIATILSVAMMLRYSFELPEAASAIEDAVDTVLDCGYRTPDLAFMGDGDVSTEEMGTLIAERLAE